MKIAFLSSVIACIALMSCSQGVPGQQIVIMSWNVQNLFDDVDNGTEYREFDPSLGEWNTDLFNRKAAALSEVIMAACGGGPDIVLLQEVENSNALELLNRGYLKQAGYSYSLFFPTEGSAVGTAVLSRLPVSAAGGHGVMLDDVSAGRNIAEIEFDIRGSSENLLVFVNHWKSKLGGAAETEDLRMASAGVLSGLMNSAAGREGLLVIAAGDFNESHDEGGRIGFAYPTAISEFRPEDAAAGTSGLFFTGSSGMIRGPQPEGPRIYYNPWPESDKPGTYCYREVWETIDQFFIDSAAFNGTGLEYGGFDTVDLELNTTAGGFPYSWSSTGADGFSDHLPVLLTLKISG